MLSIGAPALADSTPGDAVEPGDPEDTPARHLRLETRHGPVHVWTPAGYAPETAGTVVYLHGYYVDVDQAWTAHDLAAQFAGSGRNALFLVPESPGGNAEAVQWKSLRELLEVVAALADLEIPSGPLVAVAHSGGFRTVVDWLDEKSLGAVVLLDGLYGNEDDFAQWLASDGNHARSLVLVGFHTSERIERFLAPYVDAWRGARLPDSRAPGLAGSPARILYFRSQYDHMELVTAGRAIPAVLRLMAIDAVL